MEAKWIKTGIICGFLTMLIYPSMLFLDIPIQFTLILACSFGILLMIASIGLYHFIALNRKTVSLQLGVLFNIIGCSVVVMMLTIQLGMVSVKQNTDPGLQKDTINNILHFINTIQLSLDVVWDIFLSLGTILLALNMLSHPKLGRVIGISGMIIGLGLLALNISTFPIPPAEAGSFDLGPIAALWYLAVTIIITIGMKWARERLTPVNQ
jgi:hypothetical protein